MSDFELDHVFVFVSPASDAPARLREFGLLEGTRRTHAGQGTSNACYFFSNAYLELIWLSDETEIQSEVVSPLGLWERSRWRQGGVSPFGVCLRPVAPGRRGPPFKSWPYRPPYLPPGMAIDMGANSGRRDEPLLFFLSEARRPADWPEERRPPLAHAPFRSELTSLRVRHPSDVPLSPEWDAARQVAPVSFDRGDGPLLELVVGDGQAGLSKDFGPDLPIIFHW